MLRVLAICVALLSIVSRTALPVLSQALSTESGISEGIKAPKVSLIYQNALTPYVVTMTSYSIQEGRGRQKVPKACVHIKSMPPYRVLELYNFVLPDFRKY